MGDIPHSPLNKAYKKLIINLVGFFRVQKVAPKMHQTPFLHRRQSFARFFGDDASK